MYGGWCGVCVVVFVCVVCGSVVLWFCGSVFVCVLVCVWLCVNGRTIEAIPPVFKLALCRITKSPKLF